MIDSPAPAPTHPTERHREAVLLAIHEHIESLTHLCTPLNRTPTLDDIARVEEEATRFLTRLRSNAP